MTFYGQQFLYIGDAAGMPTEIINGARTARRMGSISGSTFFNAISNGGCDVLTLEPCTTTVTGGGTTLTRTAWSAVDFAATAAPWYRSAVPESAEALGFFIEEWTGLDGANHVRELTPIGAFRGGAVAGLIGHRHRVMKLNVLLHGTTERSLNYLFRWLEQQLLDCCNGSGTRQVWWRESCPALGAPEEGLKILNEVVLVEGPTWESQPTDRSGCYVRRVSFTLAAADPCMYSPDTSIASSTATNSGVTLSSSRTVASHGVWAGSTRQVVAALPAARTGSMGPIVTISSPIELYGSLRRPLPDLRITGYANPNGGAFAPDSSYCVGELIIAGSQSSGLVIEVNVPARQVRYRDPYADNQWYDGSRFIAAVASPGVPRWWSVSGCAPSACIVDPLYIGLASRYGIVSDIPFDAVSTWTVAVNSVELNGCC
jgi:hypothetical protein